MIKTPLLKTWAKAYAAAAALGLAPLVVNVRKS
jgi:hypothetical protein